MELSRTRALLPRVEWRDSTTSTNAELRELVRDAERGGSPLPHGTVLLTDSQTAGRGRLDRGWITPQGTAIAMSVLIRGYGVEARHSHRLASGTASDWGDLGPAWLPLIAGSAVQTALQPLYVQAAEAMAESMGGSDEVEVMRVGVKWPNDVHVRTEADAIAGSPGKKLCGILCELLPDGSAIVGMGINVLIPVEELPTERATSLLATGAVTVPAITFADGPGAALADWIVSDTAAALLKLTHRAGADAAAIHSRALRNSLTVGSDVRVHLPGGTVVDGYASGLGRDGSLIVDRPTGGELVVHAGDIEHLR